jgi:hypothetical protein
MVKDDEPALLDYLATLVAKEYVVYNTPGPAPTTWARRWSACSYGSAATSPDDADPTGKSRLL